MKRRQRPVIFITGATGFLGGAVIAHLASSEVPCRVVLLVRGKNRSQGLERVQRSAARFLESSRVEAFLKTARVIRGDVASEDWRRNPQLDRVTHVLHLAANTSFGVEPGMRRTNLDGALNVARCLKDKPRLARYLHVGTAMISGNKPPRIVRESDYPRADTTYPVLYPATKAEAEMSLAAEMAGYPLVVARPSIAIGHSTLGCLPSGNIFWVLRTVHAIKRVVWKTASRIDILPVDYVASSLIKLLLKPTLSYSCYHISAGRRRSVSWREICVGFEEALGEKIHRAYRRVEPRKINPKLILRCLGPGPARRLYRALELYYRFGKLDVVFDNSRLLTEGVPPPPKFTWYLERCVATSLTRSIYDQMRDDE